MNKLARAKALADEWQWQGEHARREAVVSSHFDHLSAHELIALWQSGKKLSPFEFEALVERWLAVFQEWPPFEDDLDPECTPQEPNAAKPAPMPPDDTMLRAADVVRITGLSLATLKRMTIDGRFAKPLHLSPHRIGWPGKDVRMWLEERDAARRKARP